MLEVVGDGGPGIVARGALDFVVDRAFAGISGHHKFHGERILTKVPPEFFNTCVFVS